MNWWYCSLFSYKHTWLPEVCRLSFVFPFWLSWRRPECSSSTEIPTPLHQETNKTAGCSHDVQRYDEVEHKSVCSVRCRHLDPDRFIRVLQIHGSFWGHARWGRWSVTASLFHTVTSLLQFELVLISNHVQVISARLFWINVNPYRLCIYSVIAVISTQ